MVENYDYKDNVTACDTALAFWNGKLNDKNASRKP